MTKKEQFLWIVQTMSINSAINLSKDADRRDRYRHEISATGAFMNCEEAVRARYCDGTPVRAIDAFFLLRLLR